MKYDLLIGFQPLVLTELYFDEIVEKARNHVRRAEHGGNGAHAAFAPAEREKHGDRRNNKKQTAHGGRSVFAFVFFHIF